MPTDSKTLQQAIKEVDEECSYLSAERAAFEEFRESIRLATPELAHAERPSETTEQLRETYHEVVLYGLDHETGYGDTLGDDLVQEHSPSIADILLSAKPLTQRRKRNLLMETTIAIERREHFLAEIEAERTALGIFAQEIAAIESTVETLPECSPQEQLLENLLEARERYDDLKQQCDHLLERRQEQLNDPARNVTILDEPHALNEYLYSDLDTAYPVLSALGSTVKRIHSEQSPSNLIP